MSTAMSTLEPNNDNKSGLAVGLTFAEGVILACTMPSYLIYYIDNRIYCCASNTSADREPLLDVATKLQLVSVKTGGIRVTQALTSLSKKFENVESIELMLAGEDVTGVHLVTLKSFGVQTPVCYTAQGTSAAAVLEFLKQEWTAELDLKSAERLARKAVAIGNANRSKVDLFIIFRRHN